jgi:Fe2+ transport system protein FeoA
VKLLSNPRSVVGKTVIFLTICLMLFVLSFPAKAQQAQVHQIGFLDEGSISLRAHLWQALRQRLRELGYIEGQNIAFEARGGTEGSKDSLT